TTYQAENYDALSGGTVSTAQSGYLGAAYFDFGGNGSWMEWQHITAGPSGGSTKLSFRYANGSGANRQCALSINGSVVQNISFSGTGDWNTWSIIDATVTLAAGHNVVRLTANTGNGGPNLDQVRVQDVGNPT